MKKLGTEIIKIIKLVIIKIYRHFFTEKETIERP